MSKIKRVDDEVVFEAPSTQLALPKTFVGSVKKDTSVISVRNINTLQLKNTQATLVTDFIDGMEGQSISILGDGFSSIQNGNNIVTNSGGDKLLETNKVYRFTRFKIGITLKWYEDA